MATTSADLDTRLAAARRELETVGQAHVLHFYDQLDDNQKDRLLRQVDEVDWPEVTRLIETHVKRKPEFKLPENVAPAPWYPHAPPPELRAKYAKARRTG